MSAATSVVGESCNIQHCIEAPLMLFTVMILAFSVLLRYYMYARENAAVGRGCFVAVEARDDKKRRRRSAVALREERHARRHRENIYS